MLIDRFITWGFDTRGWRQQTRRQYRARLTAFSRHAPVALRHTTGEHAAQWLATLPTTVASRNQARKAVVAFGDYLTATNLRSANPFADLPRLREHPGVPKALDAAAATAIRQAASAEPMVWQVAVGLLLHAGLRISELRLLTWDQVEVGWLRIDGKGGRMRMVPLHAETVHLLARWRRSCPCPQWVFPSPRYVGCVMSEGPLREALRRIGEAAGVARLHPHLLRHTFATQLLEVADVRVVQEGLGHTSIGTTQTYLRVRPGRLAEAVARLNYDAA